MMITEGDKTMLHAKQLMNGWAAKQNVCSTQIFATAFLEPSQDLNFQARHLALFRFALAVIKCISNFFWVFDTPSLGNFSYLYMLAKIGLSCPKYFIDDPLCFSTDSSFLCKNNLQNDSADLSLRNMTLKIRNQLFQVSKASKHGRI